MIWIGLILFFIAKDFNNKDGFASYRDVRESLRKRMAGRSEDLRRVNLVVHSESQVQQGGVYSIGREYNEYRLFPYPSGTFSQGERWTTRSSLASKSTFNS